MAGNVYVFNTTNAQLQLILNNTVISTTLAAVTQSGGYAPTSLTVARNPSSGNPGTNQFGASNVLVVSYGSGGGTAQSFQINIDSTTYPIANDLQLYIFFNIAVLEAQGGQGTTVQGNTQMVAGTPVSDAEMRRLGEKSGSGGGRDN